MDRRKTLKTLVFSSVSASVVLSACNNNDTDKKNNDVAVTDNLYRTPEEMKQMDALKIQGNFFNPHETKTLTILGDMIIPKDQISGSASDAQAVAFIDYMVRDQTHYQTPIRGGLIWLDQYAYKKHLKYFIDLAPNQQIDIVDEIAYPELAKPDVKNGVTFFNALRDLVVTAFYTSEIGYKDVGYMGNRPNQWNGVPDDVLKKHGLAYTEKELKECISYNP